MTAPTLDAEPACPGSSERTPRPAPGPAPAYAEQRLFDSVPRATWDRLAARTPWATPFSAWPFHRAWWDAYGDNAHDQTLVVCRGDGADAEPIAIVPLMHRHEVEPTDAVTHTTMRHGADLRLTPVPPTATAILLGASYHADYATILTEPDDLPAVAKAVAGYVASPASGAWDVVDLRRLRCADPTGTELAAAFGALEMAQGWTLNVDREDVCPVATLPVGVDIETYLGTLGKKERHEIRRKVRRARAVGEVRLVDSADPLADIDVFIDLHQRRWGDEGLFPPTRGGDQSRVLIRRLFELFGADGPLGLTMLWVGDRRIAAGLHFETGDELLYYNAGIDPAARELSPGVLMIYSYVQRALERGIRRMDFLRGDEPYKYEWGAVDEPIQRVLVRRGS
ncbi:MAG TPA: GNAT family N-acetyltransferase [Candidatus Limnocylindrales bacterium]|jgi:CelD/BcsL family acetyltransferase involved in cellulose biosynthesis|nr:GNAT family N-acetyltransferase [Candidatus Limnocylindrales bacterium]